MRAPFTSFGKTLLVDLHVYLDGEEVDSSRWNDEIWVERDEDWHGIKKGVLTRVVTRWDWLAAVRRVERGVGK